MTAQEIAEERKMTQVVKQYLPLVEKIVNQLWSTLSDRQKEIFDRDDLRSCALEGLVLAIRNFDPNRSNMTFQQYLAYGIRNSCLTGINEYSRTIKISYYEQQKRKGAGESLLLTKSINNILSKGNDDDDETDHLEFLGVSNDFECGEHPIDTLVRAIKEKFDPSYADIFFSIYGLDGHDELKGIELAKKYNVSNATITVRVQKVITFIKEDDSLLSTLSELL